MKNILITGATGNIGSEVIKQLFSSKTKCKVFAGVRNVANAKQKLINFPELNYVEFDFESPDSFESALKDIDIVFLLRPPQLAKIDTFIPLIDTIKAKGINNIIFLSVQGAEKSKVIPHNKIERLITSSGINYIFLRPSYFMQNITTTLYKELINKKTITLPSGNAKFNWIDIVDIARVINVLLYDFQNNKNSIIELTGNENKSFKEVVQVLNKELDSHVKYISVNPVKFYLLKKKEGVPKDFIIVMLLLHFLPRFQKEPIISNNIQTLTGKQPSTLLDFIKREKGLFNELIS